ncbi:MAG: hypothetical protein WD407_02405 [Rhodospirillales bacterium]
MPLCNQTLQSPIPEEENRYGLVGNRLMVFCSRNASAGRAETAAMNETETGDEGSSPRPLWPDWLKSTFRSHP